MCRSVGLPTQSTQALPRARDRERLLRDERVNLSLDLLSAGKREISRAVVDGALEVGQRDREDLDER